MPLNVCDCCLRCKMNWVTKESESKVYCVKCERELRDELSKRLEKIIGQNKQQEKR